jgi:hypothetical protein
LKILIAYALVAACFATWRPLPKGTCDPAIHPDPNEGLREKPGRDGCPSGTVRLGTFCIDQYEGNLIEMETGKNWSPFHNPGKRRMRAVSLESAIPQGYVSGLQAAAACRESGKRLCTDEEWLRACRGAEERVFPYDPRTRYPDGFSRRNPPCNEESRGKHPVLELFEGEKDPFSKIGHPCINQLPNAVARSGSYHHCATPEGVHDLMGNLHEWTAASSGVFRGGFYYDTRINRPGCLYVTTAHKPRYWDYSTGFRCCADPH